MHSAWAGAWAAALVVVEVAGMGGVPEVRGVRTTLVAGPGWVPEKVGAARVGTGRKERVYAGKVEAEARRPGAGQWRE